MKNNPPKAHGVRYPWDKWFKIRGRTFLARGKDYTSTSHGMIQTIRAAARRRGIRVRLAVTDAGIVISPAGNP